MRSLEVEGYNSFGAGECRAGTFRNVLDHMDAVAPHTKEAFTEEMLLGIGGGIGVEYATYVITPGGVPTLYLRFLGDGEYSSKLAQRLGIRLTRTRTGSPRKAHAALVDSIRKGRPVITFLPIAWNRIFQGRMTYEHVLSYYSLPYRWVSGGHWVVVYGVDDAADQISIADWSRRPISIDHEEFARSRAVIPNVRHAAITVESVSIPSDLTKAVRAGLRDCVRELSKSSSAGGLSGVQALDKWADRIEDPKGKRAWTKFFPKARLFEVLTQVHGRVAYFDTAGAAHRLAYSQFLEEASRVLGNPELRAVAALYGDVAAAWTDFAAATLPDSVRPLRGARDAALAWNELFLAEGQGAPKRLQKAADRVQSIRNEVAESFPLRASEVRDLLADLSARMRRVADAERRALSALKSVVR